VASPKSSGISNRASIAKLITRNNIIVTLLTNTNEAPARAFSVNDGEIKADLKF